MGQEVFGFCDLLRGYPGHVFELREELQDFEVHARRLPNVCSGSIPSCNSVQQERPLIRQ